MKSVQKLTMVCDSDGDHSIIRRDEKRELTGDGYLQAGNFPGYLYSDDLRVLFPKFKPLNPGQAVEIVLTLEEIE